MGVGRETAGQRDRTEIGLQGVVERTATPVFIAKGQLGDVQCGIFRLDLTIGADPDIVDARGWLVEMHTGIEVAGAIIIAEPAPVRRVDDQGRIAVRACRDVEIQRAGLIIQVEIRGRGRKTATIAADRLVNLNIPASLEGEIVGIGNEARLQ